MGPRLKIPEVPASSFDFLKSLWHLGHALVTVDA